MIAKISVKYPVLSIIYSSGVRLKDGFKTVYFLFKERYPLKVLSFKTDLTSFRIVTGPPSLTGVVSLEVISDEECSGVLFLKDMPDEESSGVLLLFNEGMSELLGGRGKRNL